MAIQMGCTINDLDESEICCALPSGIAKDPVNFARMVAAGILRGNKINPARLPHTKGRNKRFTKYSLYTDSMKKMIFVLVLVLFACSLGSLAQADMKETVDMIKKNLVQSNQKIKQYGWIETTKVYVKGELKSTKQNQCYYSVDGQLTKVATGGTDQPKKSRGLKGKIIENKKEEMADYVAKAVEKIKGYLPPNPEKIQQIYASGKVSIQILEPGKKFKLSFPGYLQNGDDLSVSLDKSNQKLISLDVNTYIDNVEDKVVFNVTYKDLPDGTQYPVSTSLFANAQNLKIVIENSGYRKGTGQ